MNRATEVYTKRASLDRTRLQMNRKAYIFIFMLTAVVIAISIFGPSAVSKYYDANILNAVTLESRENTEALKYPASDESLNIAPDEKLYILANALNNRILPQSDYSALIRLRNIPENSQYYALLPNYKNQNDASEDKRNKLAALSAEMGELCERGVIPEFNFDFTPDDYAISYFSAIDLHEPQKNVQTVYAEFAQTPMLSRSSGVMVSCYMDEKTNKIYSISIRTNENWSWYDPDNIAKEWSRYLGLSEPKSVKADNSLIEDTPYYKKYSIERADGGATIVTIGFFEGINEFFIKISK